MMVLEMSEEGIHWLLLSDKQVYFHPHLKSVRVLQQRTDVVKKGIDESCTAADLPSGKERTGRESEELKMLTVKQLKFSVKLSMAPY